MGVNKFFIVPSHSSAFSALPLYSQLLIGSVLLLPFPEYFIYSVVPDYPITVHVE